MIMKMIKEYGLLLVVVFLECFNLRILLLRGDDTLLEKRVNTYFANPKYMHERYLSHVREGNLGIFAEMPFHIFCDMIRSCRIGGRFLFRIEDGRVMTIFLNAVDEVYKLISMIKFFSMGISCVGPESYIDKSNKNGWVIRKSIYRNSSMVFDYPGCNFFLEQARGAAITRRRVAHNNRIIRDYNRLAAQLNRRRGRASSVSAVGRRGRARSAFIGESKSDGIADNRVNPMENAHLNSSETASENENENEIVSQNEIENANGNEKESESDNDDNDHP